MWKHAYIILLLVVLAGCTHNLTVEDMTKYGNTSAMLGQDIALGPNFFSKVDKAQNMGETVTCPTGEMAQQVFTCKNGCSWKLELLNSQLAVETRDEFPLPIFHTKATYHLTCMLTGQGSRVPLSASATGKAGLSYTEAVSHAVNGALNNIATQANMVTDKK